MSFYKDCLILKKMEEKVGTVRIFCSILKIQTPKKTDLYIYLRDHMDLYLDATQEMNHFLGTSPATLIQ